jgi:hypothetical protein
MKKILLVLSIILFHKGAFSQGTFSYNSSGNNCHCEMYFYETQNFNSKGAIVLLSKNDDLKSMLEKNDFYQSDKKKEWNFLVIKIKTIGNSAPEECIGLSINSLAKSKHLNTSLFYYLKDTASNPVPVDSKDNFWSSSYNIIYQNKPLTEIEDFLKKDSDNQLFQLPITSFNEDSAYLQKIINHKSNIDLGAFYSTNFLTASKLGLKSNSISLYGLSLIKNVTQNSAIKMSLLGSFNLPNTNSIRSQFQSKIFTAVQNGEKSLIVDETIGGHIFSGLDLAYKHSFDLTNTVRPFVAIGVGSSFVTPISARINDTLDISNFNFSNPGAGASPPELGQNRPTSGFTPFSTFSSFIEPGADFRFSPLVKATVSLPLRRFEQKNDISFSYGINLGIRFTLNANKKNPDPVTRIGKHSKNSKFKPWE